MIRFDCVAAKRRLHAFYDRELAVGDEIAVSAHVESCAECAEALAEMRLVGEALRASAATPRPM